MNELLNSVNQIRSSVDPSAVLAVGGVKSIPLADQMQFSSILKTFVNTHQEAMAAAQDPNKAPERTDSAGTLNNATREHVLNQDDSQNKYDKFDLRSADLPPEGVSLEAPRDLYTDDKPRFLPITKDPLREGSPETAREDPIKQIGALSNNGSIEPRITSDDFAALVKNPGMKPIKPLGSSADNLRNSHAEQSMPGMTKGPNSSINSKGQINSNNSGNIPSSVLTDQDLINIGKNLQASVTKNSNSPRTRAKNSTAGDTLANRQAQDLAQRLGQGAQTHTKVTVSNEVSKLHATPGQTLTNGTQLTVLGLDGENGNSLNTGFHRPGANVTPDRQATNSHMGQQNNGGTSNTQQDVTTTHFSQAVRAQAQAIGGQQVVHSTNSVPNLAPISADTANITSIANTTGQNQLSQTARTNLALAARQPHTPPVPMEQVSVQIQKAVAQGADKINIKLHPAHLGRVEVRLDIAKDGQLTAIIMAEKPETLELLQRDIRGLARSLQQAGLDANSNSFNFGLKQNGEQQADPSRNRENGNSRMLSEHAEVYGDELDASILTKQHQYGHNLSTNGGIDIRV